jgi:hypothetical protein
MYVVCDGATAMERVCHSLFEEFQEQAGVATADAPLEFSLASLVADIYANGNDQSPQIVVPGWANERAGSGLACRPSAHSIPKTARSACIQRTGNGGEFLRKWYTPRYPVARMALWKNGGIQAFYGLYRRLERAQKLGRPVQPAPRTRLDALVPPGVGSLPQQVAR